MEKQKLHTALAVWPNGQDPFDRIGAGRCTVDKGSDSGSLVLSFRARDDEGAMPYISSYEPNPMDLCLYIWISGKTGFSMEFNANGIYYGKLERMEAIVKMLKAWNKRADKLYTGGVESFDTTLRRMLAATGATKAIRIAPGFGSAAYQLVPIENAIRDYVMPAVEEVRSRLKKEEAA